MPAVVVLLVVGWGLTLGQPGDVGAGKEAKDLRNADLMRDKTAFRTGVAGASHSRPQHRCHFSTRDDRAVEAVVRPVAVLIVDACIHYRSSRCRAANYKAHDRVQGRNYAFRGVLAGTAGEGMMDA